MVMVMIDGEEWVACSGCGAYVPWAMHHPVNLKHNWWERGYRNLGRCKVETPVCPPRHEARFTLADVPR
jgi:hypothetical protein